MEGARDSSTAVPHEQISYLGKAASSFPKERPDEQVSILEPADVSLLARERPDEQNPILEPPGNNQVNRFRF